MRSGDLRRACFSAFNCFRSRFACLEFEHLFLEPRDVAIGRFQFREARAQGPLHSAELRVEPGKTGFDRGKKGCLPKRDVPAEPDRARIDLDDVGFVDREKSVCGQAP